MSIASELERLRTVIAQCYAVMGENGVTLPEEQNSYNLVGTIASIFTENGGGTGGDDAGGSDVSFDDYTVEVYSYTLDDQTDDEGYPVGWFESGPGWFYYMYIDTFCVGDVISFECDEPGKKYVVTNVAYELVEFEGTYTPFVGEIVTTWRRP